MSDHDDPNAILDHTYFLSCLYQHSRGGHDMSDGDLLERLGMDAKEWAKTFCELQAGRTVQGDAPDDNDAVTINEGTMIGWLANAIMAGYDRGYQKGCDSALLALGRDLERDSRRQA